MGAQERVTGAAPLVAQHAQELPLGVELRRVTELYHHDAGDAVDAHVRPFGALRIIRLCNLAQQAIMRSSFSSTALNETSLSRLRMSRAERGKPCRSTGLI